MMNRGKKVRSKSMRRRHNQQRRQNKAVKSVIKALQNLGYFPLRP